jgi:hypothetical protein
MYGETASAAQVSLNRPVPELGRLKAATERVAASTARIDAFLYRFNGPRPEASASGTAVDQPDNYRNDIEALFAQIERLEAVASALDPIG